MRTIGLLASGGDAPGMNACVAAIAHRAEKLSLQVRGVFGGFQGLLQANSIPIGTEISGLARRGGSFLGTSRNSGVVEELKKVGVETAMRRCCVDGLVILGGGGSLAAAACIADEGTPIVGVPCTIDNDINGTDYTLGFDSAVNKGLRAADEIMDTAESLSERIFIIETLGGTTGHIAIATAYAAGADAVFVHEAPRDIDSAAQKIRAKMDAGGTHGLVVICEGLGTAEIAKKLEDATEKRTRITALGHAQRGGSPTYLDRTFGRGFGEKAVEMLISGEFNKMTAYRGGKVESGPLAETAAEPRDIDADKYAIVNGP